MIPEYKFSIHYWSFRSTTQNYMSSESGVIVYWFYDHWFHNPFVHWYDLSWVLVFMFLAQMLALITGIASVCVNRRFLALTPIVTCTIVTVLMIYTNITLAEANIALDRYQQGYWLTYPSIALFIVNFMLRCIHKLKLDQYVHIDI